MKGYKEIRKISLGYYVTIYISELPSEFPYQILLPAFLSILESVGLNPKGVQYNQFCEKVVFSFLVFPESINLIHGLFGSSSLSEVPLLSVPGLSPVASQIPQEHCQRAKVGFYTEPQVVVFFKSIPNLKTQQKIIKDVSELVGPLNVIILVGKILLLGLEGERGSTIEGVKNISSLLNGKEISYTPIRHHPYF